MERIPSLTQCRDAQVKMILKVRMHKPGVQVRHRRMGHRFGYH